MFTLFLKTAGFKICLYTACNCRICLFFVTLLLFCSGMIIKIVVFAFCEQTGISGVQCATNEAAGNAKPGCLGHAGQTVLYGGGNPSVGHRLLCSTTHRSRGFSEVVQL